MTDLLRPDGRGPIAENPAWELTVSMTCPEAEVNHAELQARRQLMDFVAVASDWEWPLTVWFTRPILRSASQAGLVTTSITIRVVGQAAARKLGNAAKRAGVRKGNV